MDNLSSGDSTTAKDPLLKSKFIVSDSGRSCDKWRR